MRCACVSFPGFTYSPGNSPVGWCIYSTHCNISDCINLLSRVQRTASRHISSMVWTYPLSPVKSEGGSPPPPGSEAYAQGHGFLNSVRYRYGDLLVHFISITLTTSQDSAQCWRQKVSVAHTSILLHQASLSVNPLSILYTQFHQSLGLKS